MTDEELKALVAQTAQQCAANADSIADLIETQRQTSDQHQQLTQMMIEDRQAWRDQRAAIEADRQQWADQRAFLIELMTRVNNPHLAKPRWGREGGSSSPLSID